MQEILAEIRSGTFAREWIDECRNGAKRFQALRVRENDHLIERVGAKLRAMMPWSEEGKAHAAGDGGPARERAGAAAAG